MGGIKTVFFGDIAQLLPVNKNEGNIWESEIFNSVNRYALSQPVRQRDSNFVNILNKVRLCDFDESVIRFINERTVHKSELPMQCLRLYTTRELVRKANEKDYDDFPGEPIIIHSDDTYVGTKGTANAALKETRLAQTLYLKINMPVMLIQNINIAHGWVNGTVAQVDFVDEENICLRKFINDDQLDESIYWIQKITRQVPGTSYTRTQFPVIPAFASTIHKAQSATIDRVAIHLDHMLTHGQLYVAMSRVRKAENLYFFGADLPLTIKRKYGVDCDAMEMIRKKARIN
ncbi:hypothetical protein G6F43_013342 [Rhizopus delemar]|nr:hypothetical protein G6F43_013342 [Rhizopus delemar]